MAKNRLVERAKAAATRSAAESPTESHQRRYQADLSQEIGPKTFGRPRQDVDDRPTFLSVMTQPAMILILAIITFALTFIVLLWRDGRFDHLFADPQTAIVKDPKAWMLGRNADGVIEDTYPNDDEAEVLANTTTAPPTSVKAPEVSTEHEAEPDGAAETGE